MSKFILSIDQGTTGTTVSIIDKQGQSVAKVNEEYKQIYPKPGWVEHDPEDIWQSVLSTMRKSLEKAQAQSTDVAAIGITNQRETVVVWDKQTGKAIYNAIVWQCRRTTDFCEKLKKKGYASTIKNKTGLVIDPYFSGSKINWILSNVPGAKQRAKKGELLCGTIDTYLLWRLTGGVSHKTDVSNASRTQLMNIMKGDWDKELLKIFAVPANMLPEICPSSFDFGKTKGVAGLTDGIPISGIAGDQQAALFGQTCFSAGEAKCTFGTGSFILMNTGSKRVKSKSGILTTVAWQLKNDSQLTYALEGGAFVCGAAVQWLRDGLVFFNSSSEVEELARKVDDTGGVEFVPALAGLGAPHWDPKARGIITGLTRGTTREHIARATLEAMALQNAEIIFAMEKDLGKRLKNLKVDGGASANNLLMQMQSDYLGSPLYRPEMIETTAAGAAYLAGLGVGFWSDVREIKSIWKVNKEFQSQMKPRDRFQRLVSWHEAIGRATFHKKEALNKLVKKKATKKKVDKKKSAKKKK
jgi:glycerol kinase